MTSMVAAVALALAAQTALTSRELGVICHTSAIRTRAEFPTYKGGPWELAITLGSVSPDSRKWSFGSYKGGQTIESAQLSSLFIVRFLHGHTTSHKYKYGSWDVQRAMTDALQNCERNPGLFLMNEACDTSSGPDLHGRELQEFESKRHAFSQWFASQGYDKVWIECPAGDGKLYGRDHQLYSGLGNLRDVVTSSDTARVFSELLFGTSKRTVEPLLVRPSPANERTKTFIGKLVPQRTAVWSMPAWNKRVRHDVAYLIMPDGREFILAVLTSNPDAEVLNMAASQVLMGLGYQPVE